MRFDVTAFLQRIKFFWNVTQHLGEWVITFQMFVVPSVSGSSCLILLGLILTNNQLDALFHVFIYFISLHVSSITVLVVRRSNCINTSSGMISLCKWLLGMPVRRELCSLLTGIPSSHLHRLIIPDDVLIQFDLLTTSTVMLETCREMK